MGIRLDPFVVERFSSGFGGLSASPLAPIPIAERIECIEVAIAKTESVFTGEGDFLKPRTYFNAVDFVDRHSCVGHEMHGDPDCHLNLLVQELAGLLDIDVSRSFRSKGHTAIVLLGVISPSAFVQLVDRESPGIICCLFRHVEDWLPWVFGHDLEQLQRMLVRQNIVFRALPSRDMKNDLFSLLRDELFGFVGNALLVANLFDDKISAVVRAFNSNFLNGLRAKTGGPCVDEFMMLFHTHVNYKRSNFDLLAAADFSVSLPLVVVGSGPSLDDCLSDLRALEGRSLLISAGSSLGTLLRAGIRPHFHVHVERGYLGQLKSLYKDLLDSCELEDFGGIVGVLPTSIDPDLPSLYQRVVMYGRSAQTPVRAWSDLQSAVLRHEGPECLSAAFAFAMHLCPGRVFLIGCDLGAVEGAVDRSIGALGRSARHFRLRVKGNLAQSVMTSSQMLLQLSYMQAAYAACPAAPEVLNLSNGIRLPFAKPLTSLSTGHLGLDRDANEMSVDELYCAIKAPGLGDCGFPFDQTQVASAKEWIRQWLVLAERASSMPSFAFRLQASRLLSRRNYAHCEIVYGLFSGSLRDGFWLTAFAVENYCQSAADVQHCWASFARFLKALILEVDAIPSWLGVSGS